MDPIRQLSECHGKHRYVSSTQAAQGISRRLRHKTQAYHCTVCGGWHVGSIEVGRHKRLARQKIRSRGNHEA